MYPLSFLVVIQIILYFSSWFAHLAAISLGFLCEGFLLVPLFHVSYFFEI